MYLNNITFSDFDFLVFKNFLVRNSYINIDLLRLTARCLSKTIYHKLKQHRSMGFL